jgi:opacity protein-like surface antigen
MKKELLMASALVSTMGVASVAQAVTHSISGHHDAGLRGADIDTGTSDSMGVHTNSSFSVSLSETTDGGVGISTSFMLANEGINSGLQTAGLL